MVEAVVAVLEGCLRHLAGLAALLLEADGVLVESLVVRPICLPVSPLRRQLPLEQHHRHRRLRLVRHLLPPLHSPHDEAESNVALLCYTAIASSDFSVRHNHRNNTNVPQNMSRNGS